MTSLYQRLKDDGDQGQDVVAPEKEGEAWAPLTKNSQVAKKAGASIETKDDAKGE